MAGKTKSRTNVIIQQQQQQQIAVVPLKHKAPIKEIDNMIDIEKYFNEQILDQTTSIRNLSVKISNILHNTRFIVDDETSRLHMITIAGPSGTGKTATARCLRHLLGMDKGFQYEDQFIEFEGGNDSTIIIKETHELLDKLNHAVAGNEYPPYIMLYIDDYQQTSTAFRILLNKLMGKGQYKTPEGTEFLLPAQTALLIVCTSRYGEEEIIKMPVRCDDTAKRYITSEMQQEGSAIQGRNLVLPYYPLDDEVFEKLLGQKFDNFLSSPYICKQPGVEVLNSTPEMKKIMIKHVLAKIDRRRGMHGGVRMLEDKLNVLFETSFAVIGRMRQEKESVPIYLDSFTFDTRLFGEILDKELDRVTGDIIRTIRDNPENKQYLDKCDPSLNGTVEAVSMRYGERPVCGLIMSVTYVNINNFYDVNETAKLIKVKNKRLKACIMKIGDAIGKKDSSAMIDSIIKNHHELLNESSDDSGEENKQRLLSNKRKITTLEEPLSPIAKKVKLSHSSSSSSASSSSTEDEETKIERLEHEMEMYFSEEDDEEDMFSESEISFNEVFCSEDEDEWKSLIPKMKIKKRGRPTKIIDGFRRIEYHNKNPRYKCIKCRKELSKACYTKSHICLDPHK